MADRINPLSRSGAARYRPRVCGSERVATPRAGYRTIRTGEPAAARTIRPLFPRHSGPT